MRTFTRKGYGRIFCRNSKEVAMVKAIIKEMDEFEFDYLPEKLITTISQWPQTEYTGKFDDLDLDKLAYQCMIQDCPIVIIDHGNEPF